MYFRILPATTSAFSNIEISRCLKSLKFDSKHLAPRIPRGVEVLRQNFLEEQRSLKAGDLSHQESNNMAASTMKLQSDSFSSEKVRNQKQKKAITTLKILQLVNSPIKSLELKC
ncbi:hypothetical protein K0M31_011767 [Melipona bicolor]|uniref:Uncharacterized protein n=1 Tax=Melipona bicolor TaxID=60889 RepID=A0AA40GAE2_9HYME|nr:hypothetical protein K0M31_011767 [Melipona bicolor]